MIRAVERHELPTGTVTFLFTDMEGSTRLLQEHGARLRGPLAEHRRALREAFARHGGVEVDTQGDAFFVAFARATDAVAAAADGRAALAGGPIRVRMGIHTGEPLVTDEGYVGIDVHRAARIAAAAHGGQIVVSDDDATTSGRRRRRIRDSGRAPAQGPRPRRTPLPARRRRLPAAAHARRDESAPRHEPLVGREREVEELGGDALGRHALVTVTGPGGTGKTRLALQVAAELVGTQRDGVFWVPLAGLSDPELARLGDRADDRGARRPRGLPARAGSCSSCSTTSSTSSTLLPP